MKISVVIPTYNSEKYICETINSVFAQSFHDFEIIAVDNGSTDGTRTILSRYGEKIVCLNQAKKGVSAARNLGIKESKGEWVAFLDSDDLWTSERLKLLHDIIESYPDACCIFTDAVAVDESDTIIISPSMMRPQEKIVEKRSALMLPPKNNAENSFRQKLLDMKIDDGVILFRDLYDELLFSGNVIITSTVLVKKECLNRIGYFDENLLASEDYELWMRIASRYPMLYFNRVTTKYRMRTDSLTGNAEMRPFVWAKWNGEMFEKCINKYPAAYALRIKQRICQLYNTACWGYLRAKNFSEARRLCVKSIYYNRKQMKLYLYLFVSFFHPKLVFGFKSLLRRSKTNE